MFGNFFSDEIWKKIYFTSFYPDFFPWKVSVWNFLPEVLGQSGFMATPGFPFDWRTTRLAPAPAQVATLPQPQSLVISFPVNLIKLFSEKMTQIGISPNTTFLGKLLQKRFNFNSKEEITTDTQVEPPQGCN